MDALRGGHLSVYYSQFRGGWLRGAFGRWLGVRLRLSPGAGRGAAVGVDLLGVAAGTVIGSAATNSAAQSAAVGGSADCASRYASYGPASGSFLGYDGFRHPCP